MKAFIEEYGLIIVAVIIIFIMVAAATGLGNSILTGIQSIITDLTTSM